MCRWHRQGKKAELSRDTAERSLTVWWRGGDGITGVKGSAPGGHWDGVVGGGIVAELTAPLRASSPAESAGALGGARGL